MGNTKRQLSPLQHIHQHRRIRLTGPHKGDFLLHLRGASGNILLYRTFKIRIP